MLSINIESTALITINTINIGTTLYLTSFARRIHSQRKNPTLAIPSTITIIPAMNIIVAQLMPDDSSDACPLSYQKFVVKIFFNGNGGKTHYYRQMHTRNHHNMADARFFDICVKFIGKI